MNNKTIKCITLILLTVLLSSCQTFSQQDDLKNTMAINEIDAYKNKEPENSNKEPITTDQALSTIMTEEPPELEVEEEDRFDLSVKDANINSFLLGLVESTDYNLIVSPELDLTISLHLKDVTISEVLQALTQIYPVVVKRKNNLLFVSSAETMTSIYNVDYLNLQRSGTSQTSVSGQSVSTDKSGGSKNRSSGGNKSSGSGSKSQQSSSSMVETRSDTDFWKELTTSLNLMIQGEPKASIVVSPHVGLVVVRALPQTHNLIKNYLRRTQESLNRQVIIEAKIIEVRLNEGFQAGIDWGANGNYFKDDPYAIRQQGQTLRQEASDTPINGIFSLLYQGNSFTAAIDLLKSQGDVQVLSSPRVSTVNNQKAIIKVGSDEFFVTDISTTTVTGTSTATTPDVTLTQFFSGISLDVTPQVNENGDIILHIHPVVSEVTDQAKTLSLGEDSFVLPLALTNVRESDSIVKTKHNQVVVIGGLMQNSVTEEISSTPFLSDIPFFGNLFKQTRQRKIKSELVILLKAHLVKTNETNQQLDQIKHRFENF